MAWLAARGLAAQDSSTTQKKTATYKKSTSTAKRKSLVAKTTPQPAVPVAKPASAAKPVSTATHRHSSKASKSATTRKYIQQQPTPDRYREIQQALADKGYFSGPVDGTWGPASVDALKRFQREQSLTDDGKIGSLSLIALGLGPRRTAPAETAAGDKSQVQQR